MTSWGTRKPNVIGSCRERPLWQFEIDRRSKDHLFPLLNDEKMARFLHHGFEEAGAGSFLRLWICQIMKLTSLRGGQEESVSLQKERKKLDFVKLKYPYVNYSSLPSVSFQTLKTSLFLLAEERALSHRECIPAKFFWDIGVRFLSWEC